MFLAQLGLFCQYGRFQPDGPKRSPGVAMIAKPRTLLLSGASVLAAAAAFMPPEAGACSAVTAVRNGIDVVDIVCTPGDAAVAPFSTDNEFSDGSGIDTLTMSGGAILANGRRRPWWMAWPISPRATASSTCSAATTSSLFRVERSAAPRRDRRRSRRRCRHVQYERRHDLGIGVRTGWRQHLRGQRRYDRRFAVCG